MNFLFIVKILMNFGENTENLQKFCENRLSPPCENEIFGYNSLYQLEL